MATSNPDFTEISTYPKYPVGAMRTTKNGNRYRYVKFATANTYAQYQALTITATYGTLTNETSAGSLPFMGIAQGVPVALSYGWVMVEGYSYVIFGTDDTTAYAETLIFTDEDGKLEGSTATALTIYSAGIVLATQTSADEVGLALIRSQIW